MFIFTGLKLKAIPLIISTILFVQSCGGEKPGERVLEENEALLSTRIPDTTFMDTLEVGVLISFKPAKEHPYTAREMNVVDEDFFAYQTPNKFPLEVKAVNEEPLPIDTIYDVYPDTIKAEPFVSYITYPELVPADEMQKSQTASESIMYLGLDQGLPSSSVNKVVEDRYGVMDGDSWRAMSLRWELFSNLYNRAWSFR